MADIVDRETRSRNMSRIRSRNTRPEMIVRRLLHGMGYRYRLHTRSLPGTPDLVFHSRKAVIFVHGCFWHRHDGCGRASTPHTRVDFWLEKFQANRNRDEKVRQALTDVGWRIEIIWECELRDLEALAQRLAAFLEMDQGLPSSGK